MTAQQAADKLNEMHELDPKATDGFFQLCTPVNQALADHPRFVVSAKRNEKTGDWHSPVIRPLGLINGMISDSDTKRVAAQFDNETNRLLGFVPVDTSQVDPDQ